MRKRTVGSGHTDPPAEICGAGWGKIDADDPLGGVLDRNLFHPEWWCLTPFGPVCATLISTGTFRRDGSVGALALLTAKIFP